MADLNQLLAVCDRSHDDAASTSYVYRHYGSKQTCLRVREADIWVYDPAQEMDPNSPLPGTIQATF